MKRGAVILKILVVYTILGLVTRAMEGAGRITCECYEDCWCKRPGLSIYRWVFPRFHHLRPCEDAEGSAEES
jgi:hypothetical protein